MQVFLTGTVLETAKALDKQRLNKQIIECQQILDAINGTGKGWFNHPVVHMYKNHAKWLQIYKWILEEWREEKSDLLMLFHLDDYCTEHMPGFINEAYLTNMKRRLYTKNNNHYKQWEELGTSDVNWYYVDGKWKKYKDGKCLGIFDEISNI